MKRPHIDIFLFLIINIYSQKKKNIYIYIIVNYSPSLPNLYGEQNIFYILPIDFILLLFLPPNKTQRPIVFSYKLGL